MTNFNAFPWQAPPSESGISQTSVILPLLMSSMHDILKMPLVNTILILMNQNTVELKYRVWSWTWDFQVQSWILPQDVSKFVQTRLEPKTSLEQLFWMMDWRSQITVLWQPSTYELGWARIRVPIIIMPPVIVQLLRTVPMYSINGYLFEELPKTIIKKKIHLGVTTVLVVGGISL